MCGILFVKSERGLEEVRIREALMRQAWRGPDATGLVKVSEDCYLGHVRLSILDTSHDADQPMRSRCGRYSIVFNGEIYNHQDVRSRHGLEFRTHSDTETILEGFVLRGPELFRELDGMFALVIVDHRNGDWWSARDRYGITPLFLHDRGGTVILSSESVSIRQLVDCSVSQDSLEEWRFIRRPIPGFTYFQEISEVLPGTVSQCGRFLYRMDVERAPGRSADDFSREEFEQLLTGSVRSHELRDVENVCPLSGGLDSSVIPALSIANRACTVGLVENHEFEEAAGTAAQLGKELVRVPGQRKISSRAGELSSAFEENL